LKAIHANRSPAIAPMSVLKDVDLARIALQPEQALAHLDRLRTVDGLGEKLQRVFSSGQTRVGAVDPELALYDGFPSDADKRLFRAVRETPPEQLGARMLPFRDARYVELLFRYRARNWPETLAPDEAARWDAFRRKRIETQSPLTTLSRDDYFMTIARLRADPALRAEHIPLLDALESWAREAT
jgi:exodeoxyribonuclease-1